MDADGNGRVSAAEHAAAAQRTYRVMDRDRDGLVALAELAAARGFPVGQLGDTEILLQKVDSNGDGVMDEKEHRATTKAEFGLVDQDGDGVLSAAELQAADAPAR